MVKLMGRHSGFIACSAALATNEADFVLIPGVSFGLEGENGLLEALHRCILQKGNALIVVAEGAGQDLFNDSNKDTDPSGKFYSTILDCYSRDISRNILRNARLT